MGAGWNFCVPQLSQEKAMKIDNTVFLSYLRCPFKSRLLLGNQFSGPTDYQVLTADLAHHYKSLAQAAICREFPDFVISPDPATAPYMLDHGPSLILDARIEIGDFEFHFDALRRSLATDSSGSAPYEPVVFHFEDTVPEFQQLLLAFGGYVLRLCRGRYPTTGIVVHGPQCSLRSMRLTPKYPRVELIAATLSEIAKQGKQIPLLLNKNCATCEFQSRCLAEAKEQDNLTLLNRMTEKTVQQYARKGIFTLTQLSYTYHPRRQSKRAKVQARPHSFALQALAIREQRIYILAPPQLPPAETRLFIDMEGVPDGSFVYLIGLLVQQKDREQTYSFWADSRNEEMQMFKQFAQACSQFPAGHIFHYGSYETRVLKRIGSQLAPAISESFIADQSTNVLSTLYERVYFPTYSNRLKDVAGSLGYVWQAPTSSGLQTVVWRHQWEQNRDPAFKATLLGYNLDDCRALKLLTTLLYDIGAQTAPQLHLGSRPEVVQVESLANETERRNDALGKQKYAMADFEAITKCAYFEYQRARVFLRTNFNFRNIQRRQSRKEKKPAVRVNKVVVCRARTCPFCKCRDLALNEIRPHTKLSFDLRISRGGMSRIVTRYRCHWYKCSRCCRCFLPNAYTEKERFGHNFAAWVIHQHIANRVTYQNLATTARECFSLPINFRKLYEFKARFAQYYGPAYKKLFESLVSGPLLHADETTFNLQKGKCYVWVFTNMEEVVFVYRPDRNTSFLHDLLGNFHGILVTDFFTGYDSLECPQQKCLVHLIRDLNDGLLADPFDEGLRVLGTKFGQLLRNIIATIDRFGLRTKYLKKHKQEVKAFFEEMAGQVFESTVARTLYKRMAKYSHELFTFLDYDGIPWNNNNAEHAIKYLAKYRRLVNGRVTETGLTDYLKLLSLYETCRYQEIGFLKFLVSKEREMDRFAERS